jgi:hypothetical protein
MLNKIFVSTLLVGPFGGRNVRQYIHIKVKLHQLFKALVERSDFYHLKHAQNHVKLCTSLASMHASDDLNLKAIAAL